MASVTLYTGDTREIMQELEPDSIDCAFFSPPYWSARLFGDEPGQIGLEPSIAEHMDTLSKVVGCIERVLRPTGTLWINYGDTYISRPNGTPAAVAHGRQRDDRRFRDKPMNSLKASGLPPKTLALLPQRLMLRLSTDGWRIRNVVTWAKTNPRPERQLDRFSVCSEVIIFAVKSQIYYFNADAVREPKVAGDGTRLRRDVWAMPTEARAGHTATFPRALAEICLKAGCPPGGTVLDPFSGLGTTCAVAADLGLSSIGIEISPTFNGHAAKAIQAAGHEVFLR